MSAQCSGEVKWEVRNGIGKGIAWDVMLAISIPCMVQQSSFQKWRGTEKDRKRGDRDGQRFLCKEWLSRLGTFSLEKILLRKQMRELLKNHERCGGFNRKLCLLPHWYRNHKTSSKFTRWQIQNSGKGFLCAMHDKLWSSFLQDTAGGEILHSSKEDQTKPKILFLKE